LFQAMLAGDKILGKKTHPVRHEVLSALLICQLENPLKNWLEKVLAVVGDEFRWQVSWVTGGHHLKLHKDQDYLKKDTDRLVRLQGVPSEFVFWGSHPDLNEVLRLTANSAPIEGSLPVLQDLSISLDEFGDEDSSLSSIVDEYILRSEAVSLKLSEEESAILAHAKAVLIASDVAGSALWQEVSQPCDWIAQALSNVLDPQEIQRVIDAGVNGAELRSFQKAVAASTHPVTLTIAGCGNGKTLAAYCWAKRNATGRKLFFCYPTTGTASAGFEDYLLAQSDLERALVHGRSLVDMERMEEILRGGDDDLLEENQRLESLKAWPQKVVACTVDIVLGLIQNQRRALFSFPALLRSAFVFDEIHNYDGKLFGALLTFLSAYPDAPVLLMSASIPDSRLSELRQKLGERLSEPIGGDPDIEDPKRYVLKWREGTSDCWTQVKRALHNKLKVLWVSNTVAGAMSLWDEALAKDLPVEPMIYHSRFRYADRVERQASVIKCFKPERQRPALAIATQVCEMSLNISSDLMVSALAPFPSIIQRLGRLNRYSKREPGKRSPVCDCLIYNFECRNNQPYSSEELAAARTALGPLWEVRCSQSDLAGVLGDLQLSQDIKTSCAWLDGKWQSYQRPLREPSASVTIVMETDLPEILNKLKAKGMKPNSRNVAAWTIPMPYASGMSFDRRLGGYPVVSDSQIEYVEKEIVTARGKILKYQTGARWRKQPWQIL
jgi:CRISPR-associated endonuclease/helicase Cas3